LLCSIWFVTFKMGNPLVGGSANPTNP
jgi:hypothetical protein